MKKTIASLLAAASLLVAPSVAMANGDIPALELDSASPYVVKDNVILVENETTAAMVRSAFLNNGDIVFTAPDKHTLALADEIGSGVTARRSGSDEAVTLIVPGDVYGDGKINARDVIGAMRIMVGQTDGMYPLAADVDHDGEVTAKDVIKIMRFLVGYDEHLGIPQRVVADKDDAQITMYFDSIMNRVERNDTKVYGSTDGLYYTAKNELEDAQIVLISETQKKDLTLEVSAPTNANGKKLAHEVRYGYYYELGMFTEAGIRTGDIREIGKGNYTDPYPPLTGAFNLESNESKSFMVQVDVPADAESGYYRSDVILKDSAGNEIKRAELRFYVWNFALEEETACDTLFNLSRYSLSIYYSQVYDPKYAEGDVIQPLFEENFFKFMLKNRLSNYTLPYDIRDSRADEYLSNPRVTAFVSLGGMDRIDWSKTEEKDKLKSIYDKLQTNPVWAEKAYIYTVDEPWGVNGAEAVKNQWNSAKAVLGDTPFKTVLPFGNKFIDELGVDTLDCLWDYCNAFCPNADVTTPSAPAVQRREDRDKYPNWGLYPSEKAIEKYGTFLPRYDKLRERGDSMWWYVCNGPGFPYANFFNCYQGAWTRVVLWEQYTAHADGILYWDTVLWQMGDHDGKKINLTRTNGGDGLLVYDGMLWGALDPTAVPCGRLEAVRDGVEDFQYMHQLEDKIGREGVLKKYVSRITTDVTHYNPDYHDMIKVRNEMGFDLEELAK